MGIKEKNGCFAEYITLPINNIHVIPDSIADDEAVFVEPLAAALQILAQVRIRPQDDVMILGDGRLGQLCAQVISLTGANVLTVGKHLKKLTILKNEGIKTCIFDEFSPKKSGCCHIMHGVSGWFQRRFKPGPSARNHCL